MKQRIFEDRTGIISILKLVFSGIPYRISYLPSYYVYNNNTKEVIKIGSTLLWTNHKNIFVVRLSNSIAYSTERPIKKTFTLINKQSEVWKSIEGEL